MGMYDKKAHYERKRKTLNKNNKRYNAEKELGMKEKLIIITGVIVVITGAIYLKKRINSRCKLQK